VMRNQKPLVKKPNVYVYLFGGLGNNLFQVNHGLTLGAGQVFFVTNLIESRFWSQIFRWAFHEPTILKVPFLNDVQFKRISTFLVFAHISNLIISRVLQKPVFGVSWESLIATRVNFGYFQDCPSESWVIKFRSKLRKEHFDHVVHLRLGDSPTLQVDVDAQIKLLNQLKHNMIYVVTNDRASALKLLKKVNTKVAFVGGNVIDDLEIMRCSKTLIIPQSTFSLIAAFSSHSLQTLYVDEKFWKLKGKECNYSVIYY